jgi:uncharacterized damage-inducible protein DinB
MLAAHFRTMAAYNRWANRRLYDAAARLPDADYRADRKVFFRSLHGTLNHLLLADRMWLMRLTGRGEVPPALDAILYERLADLTVAREAEDERLNDYVAGLDGPALARTISYRNVKGAEMSASLGTLLAHVCNHQTHHRGQAHAILTGLDREAPVLDLIEFLRTSR